MSDSLDADEPLDGPDPWEWLDTFEAELNVLFEIVHQFGKTSPSAEDAAYALARLHAMKGEFNLIYADLEHIMAEAMGDSEIVALPDGTHIEKKLGASRTGWRHEDLAAVVARRIENSSIDFETGERLKTVEEMIRDILKYAGVSYWKVKPLKELGIDADQYCKTGDVKTSIAVRKPK